MCQLRMKTIAKSNSSKEYYVHRTEILKKSDKKENFSQPKLGTAYSLNRYLSIKQKFARLVSIRSFATAVSFSETEK